MTVTGCGYGGAVASVLGLKEVAALLGVSRQRATQLVRDYEDFPAPVADLASGRVWDREAVERWAVAHKDRRPGRPRGTGTEDSGAERA
jgi:prophage regulatory protein